MKSAAVVALMLVWSMPLAAQETPSVGNASASPGPGAAVVSPLVGSWDGYWEGARKGGLAVVFTSSKSGTLMATGTDSFGSDPKPLRDVTVNGQTVKFKAGPFDVTARLEKDKLTGTGWYNGYQYDIVLERKTPEQAAKVN